MKLTTPLIHHSLVSPGLARSLELFIACTLAVAATFPVVLYAIPGFEFTPSVVFFPLVFLLLRFDSPIDFGVVCFSVLCMVVGAIGYAVTGQLRNVLGAASYSYSVYYIVAGAALYRYFPTLGHAWRLALPAMIFLALALTADLIANGGYIRASGAYMSASYSRPEASYIRSMFPFYGKYGVITFSTCAMVLSGIALSSISVMSRGFYALVICILASLLMAIAASMMSRQVLIGIAVFYILLFFFTQHKLRAVVLFVTFCAFTTTIFANSYIQRGGTLRDFFVSGGASYIPTIDEQAAGFPPLAFKLEKTFDDAAAGDLGKLSSGRIDIYRQALGLLSPKIVLVGCGFCDLRRYGFELSTLHNSFLTALYKGGILYMVVYSLLAFAALFLIRRTPRSWGNDVFLALFASILIQSLFWEVIFLQVVAPIMFVTTGYLLASRVRQPSAASHVVAVGSIVTNPRTAR